MEFKLEAMRYQLEGLRIYRDVEHDRRSAEKFESVCKAFRVGGQVLLSVINPVAAIASSVGATRGGLPSLMSGGRPSITYGR